MKATSSETQSGPSRVIEAIVGRLIPPEERELVLGDLCERYTSPLSYLGESIRILPFIVFIQIRRTLDRRLLMIQGVALLCSFQLAWHTVDSFAPLDQSRTVILFPVVLALVALVLCRAYALPEQRSRLRAAMDAVIALVGVVAGELVLIFVAPTLLLPPPVLPLAASISIVLLTLLAEPNPQGVDDPGNTRQEVCTTQLGQEARAFHQRVRRFNRLEQCASMVVFLVFSGALCIGTEVLPNAGKALMMLALVYATVHAGGRQSERRIPLCISWNSYRAFHQNHLERQRVLLESVSTRYVLPLLAALTFVLFAGGFHFGIVGNSTNTFEQAILGFALLAGFGLILGAAGLVKKHSHRALSRLKREIEALDMVK